MVGYLTTHVLNIAEGRPAVGMRVEVWRMDVADSARGGERTLLKEVRTNADGRTDRPLLDETEMDTGVYELVFAVGEYFAAQGQNRARDPFLDLVPVRFRVASATSHYHVPLLFSPWAYSTYRGS